MNDRIDDLVAAHKADSHSPPPATMQRWHDAIDDAAAREQPVAQPTRGTVHPTSFFMGMAIAATLALGIAIGVFIGNDDAPIATGSSTAVGVPAALSRGLQVHFRDSRDQIMSLPDAEDPTMLVLQIIQQNRMFENAAINSNAPKVARVLRALEPVLLQLAAEDIAPNEAEALQAQLAFELNVMLTKLSAESSDDSQTT